MNIRGRELAYYENTESDEACFNECLYFSSYDYDDDGNAINCAATVRRENGDCYLHAKTIDDAVSTSMRTYVSYCTQSAASRLPPSRPAGFP